MENGQSLTYLGMHFGINNYQGQLLGPRVADAIIQAQSDPAVVGTNPHTSGKGVSSAAKLKKDSANSGYFGGL